MKLCFALCDRFHPIKTIKLNLLPVIFSYRARAEPSALLQPHSLHITPLSAFTIASPPIEGKTPSSVKSHVIDVRKFGA